MIVKMMITDKLDDMAQILWHCSSDALFMLDDSGNIIHINDNASTLFNYHFRELQNKSFAFLLAKKHRAEIDFKNDNFSIPVLKQDILGQKKTGELFPIRLSVNETALKNQPVYIVQINDLTQQELSNQKLTEANEKVKKEAWLRDMALRMHAIFRGEKTREILSQDILREIVTVTEAHIGAFYFFENDTLHFMCGHAFPYQTKRTITIGEGISGQAAQSNEIILLNKHEAIPYHLESSSHQYTLNAFMAIPLPYEGEILGVIEIGSLNQFDEQSVTFMNQIREAIGISLNLMLSREQLKCLLDETKIQTLTLKEQSDKINASNIELREFSQELQTRQEELEQTNEELEEQRAELEAQTNELEQNNRLLSQTKEKLLNKTEELEESNRYKSEFLANMSHELRTPLNSILVLSQLYLENRYKNLNDNQLESAKTIYTCGNSLLSLINDILDLSKVEANHMIINPVTVETTHFIQNIDSQFKPLAEKNNLTFDIKASDTFPETFVTDPLRLEQILRNLIGNAIKFTEKGGIKVALFVESPDTKHNDHYNKAHSRLAFSVMDSGIGIAEEKFDDIFKMFQQIDGTSSRKYAGTGLGLTISSRLSTLLKGEITLESTPGKGSNFTLLLPFDISKLTNNSQKESNTTQEHAIRIPAPSVAHRQHIIDDREKLKDNIPTLLIIEDDIHFANILVKFGHEHGLQCVIATDGQSGLERSKELSPAGIILDIQLPEVDGLTVLKTLKDDIATRFIPVHVISIRNVEQTVLKQGALSFLEKPVDKNELDRIFKCISEPPTHQTMQILLIEDNKQEQEELVSMFKPYPVDLHCFTNASEAIHHLQKHHIDLVILDLILDNETGFDYFHKLDALKNTPHPPVIVYTAKDLTDKEKNKLEKRANALIFKVPNKRQLLFDEISVFFSEMSKMAASNASDSLPIILVVDDDEQSLFSVKQTLSSLEAVILTAKNGKDALEIYNHYPHISLIVLDMMMPEMSGYEVASTIRKDNLSIPIIALTAKAMKSDKERCQKSGCTDYLTKPVDVNQLLSLVKMRLV